MNGYCAWQVHLNCVHWRTRHGSVDSSSTDSVDLVRCRLPSQLNQAATVLSNCASTRACSTPAASGVSATPAALTWCCSSAAFVVLPIATAHIPALADRTVDASSSHAMIACTPEGLKNTKAHCCWRVDGAAAVSCTPSRREPPVTSPYRNIGKERHRSSNSTGELGTVSYATASV